MGVKRKNARGIQRNIYMMIKKRGAIAYQKICEKGKSKEIKWREIFFLS